MLLGSVNVSTISMGRRATKSPLTAWKEGGQQDDTCCDGGSRPMESEIGQHGEGLATNFHAHITSRVTLLCWCEWHSIRHLCLHFSKVCSCMVGGAINCLAAIGTSKQMARHVMQGPSQNCWTLPQGS